MAEEQKQWLKWVAELQALAQSGLTYTQCPFDKERYERIEEITAQMAAACSHQSVQEIRRFFSLEKGYATPKVDVRSFVLKDEKVLLVKERADGLWTLPGGWADVSETPSEAIMRETKEETGYDVSVIRLLAFWDKMKHDHPVQWPHIYKCFFHCEIISGHPIKNMEIAAVDFFSLGNLPPLSTPRVTAKQIATLHAQIIQKDIKTYFD